MNGHQLARRMTHRVNYRIRHANTDDGAVDLLAFGIAQVRAPMTRPRRVGLAIQLAYAALTGRKP